MGIGWQLVSVNSVVVLRCLAIGLGFVLCLLVWYVYCYKIVIVGCLVVCWWWDCGFGFECWCLGLMAWLLCLP